MDTKLNLTKKLGYQMSNYTKIKCFWKWEWKETQKLKYNEKKA